MKLKEDNGTSLRLWVSFQRQEAQGLPGARGVVAAQLFADTVEFLFYLGGHSQDAPWKTFHQVNAFVQEACPPGDLGQKTMDTILPMVWVHGDIYADWLRMERPKA